jgi:cbb3-type cytochrome oxidase subunit 3
LGTVITRILEFLRSLMPSWIPRLPVSGATSGLTWAFAALALVAIGIIVYQFLKRRRSADDSPAQPLAEPERLPDAVLLMTRAKAALEAGDTFEALRLGFQAVLAVLEDRGIVRYDPARTNSEYVRDLRPQPALAADFRRIALPFDRAFYGKIRPATGDVEQTLKFCESLMSVGATS